jgi:hypothetical protein
LESALTKNKSYFYDHIVTEGVSYSASWIFSSGCQLVVGFLLPSRPIVASFLSGVVGAVSFYSFSGLSQGLIEKSEEGQHISNALSVGTILSIGAVSHLVKSEELSFAKTLTTTSAFTLFAFPFIAFDPDFTFEKNVTFENALKDGKEIANTCSYVTLLSIAVYAAGKKYNNIFPVAMPLVSLAISNAGELLAYDLTSGSINNGTLDSWYSLTSLNIGKSLLEAALEQEESKVTIFSKKLMDNFFSYISLWLSRPLFYYIKDLVTLENINSVEEAHDILHLRQEDELNINKDKLEYELFSDL